MGRAQGAIITAADVLNATNCSGFVSLIFEEGESWLVVATMAAFTSSAPASFAR